MIALIICQNTALFLSIRKHRMQIRLKCDALLLVVAEPNLLPRNLPLRHCKIVYDPATKKQEKVCRDVIGWCKSQCQPLPPTDILRKWGVLFVRCDRRWIRRRRKQQFKTTHFDRCTTQQPPPWRHVSTWDFSCPVEPPARYDVCSREKRIGLLTEISKKMSHNKRFEDNSIYVCFNVNTPWLSNGPNKRDSLRPSLNERAFTADDDPRTVTANRSIIEKHRAYRNK